MKVPEKSKMTQALAKEVAEYRGRLQAAEEKRRRDMVGMSEEMDDSRSWNKARTT